ncbi:MAG: TetR/AcrR family transcriptional regulator [Leptospirillia bacterium]
MDKQIDTREQILDAADARFRRFGFGKTTMAEIAGDCDMSAANLYRYFKNKAEIGAAIAQRCMSAQAELLRQVVRTDGLSAAEKISRFVIGIFNYNHDQLANEPAMAELVQLVTRQHKDEVRRHKIEVMRSLMAEIIAEGNRTGEFDVSDVVGTAQTVLMGTFAFHSPFLIMADLFDRDELTQMAKNTAQLLVQGLAAR